MWSHPKLKNQVFHGNYELAELKDFPGVFTRVIRFEHRNAQGETIGKVYTFISPSKAKKPNVDPLLGGWTYTHKGGK